jgi:hypothetical protein
MTYSASDGEDLRKRPLHERRKRLADLLSGNDVVRMSRALPPPYVCAAPVHVSGGSYAALHDPIFETPDGEAFTEILQVYVGVALILLGVLLTGIAVLRVMSL